MENFLRVLTEDAAVREDFLQQTTPEGAYLVAKPYLDGMPMEEFVEELLGIARVMDKAQQGELTEAEITTVSGGGPEYGENEEYVNFAEAMVTFNEHF